MLQAGRLQAGKVVRRPGALVAIVTGVLGMVTTGGVVVYLLLEPRDISSCAAGDPVGPPLDAIFVIACVAAFIAGGLLSGAPRLTRRSTHHRLKDRHARGRITVQVVLVAVLLTLTLLMVYETWSVSILDDNPNPEFWPITYFVHCASRLATAPTLPVAGAMCAFFGKWLWYRPGVRG